MKILSVFLFSAGWLISQRPQKGPAPAIMAMGKKVYTERCMTCHQVDGVGAQNMIPPLTKTEYVLGNKSRLIQILLNGMTGDITVNGEIYSGEMPSHKSLTDAEMAAVLTYIRNSFGNKASVVSKIEVQKLRGNQ